ncbi:MAG: M14 family zinc carboxypeptidase, partial [bacterium]|nr:M14 family zinc carboxypeptidase [bacterium]
RDVWNYERGRGKPIARTSNYSAARGSNDARSYLGRQRKGYRQTLLLVGGVHGMEVEAIAGLVNLLHILEGGKDLRGRPWPAIRRFADRLRLLIVPLANPDGRARTRIPSLVGLTAQDQAYYGQGMWKDGSLITWLGSKEFMPLPLDKVIFSGGYPNDDGVNLMHDVSPAGCLATETRALMALAETEIIDACLNMHSYPFGPALLPHDKFCPAANYPHTHILAKRVHHRLHQSDLRPLKIPDRNYRPQPDGSFNMGSAMHHASGCLSLCLESPHGLVECPYTYEELLDIQLLTIEETMRFGVEERFCPEQSTGAFKTPWKS